MTLENFVLISALQNYKKALFVIFLIVAAGEIMPLRLRAKMRYNFWKGSYFTVAFGVSTVFLCVQDRKVRKEQTKVTYFLQKKFLV